MSIPPPGRTKTRIALLVALSILALSLGCRDQRSLPLPSEVAPVSAALTDGSSLWSAVVDGETGPGTSYRIYMPANWNRKLVVYAQGLIPPFFRPGLPGEGDDFAQVFGLQGFAVAMSSYKETGLSIKDGAQRTHQLSGLFASRFGPPQRTYLVGRSMGGFIVTSLAEKYPGQYDGVMPVCGAVGGVSSVFAYFLNERILFDYLYPGVLPGTATSVPMPSDPDAAFAAIDDIYGRALSALFSDARLLPGATQIALVDQTLMPLPGGAPFFGPVDQNQFTSFLVTPLINHAVLVNDIVLHTQGHMPIGNDGVTYTSSAPSMAGAVQAINAGVVRVAADRDALNWVANNGETSGQLSIPMLTLHTRYDTQIPLFTEGSYRSKVAAAGRSDLLVQRTTEGFDHCNFSGEEIGRGLSDLVKWVEHGQKPKP
jgi:pimeloyl-ACP methyl ester carboxylesterase